MAVGRTSTRAMIPSRWARVRWVVGGAVARTFGRAGGAREALELPSTAPDDALPAVDTAGSTDTLLDPGDAAPSRTTLQPGELVAARFRIVRLLGAGGMGEVYEARDEALGVGLALKTVRLRIRWNEERKLQLLHEVQLARRVTHGNVCRIHDLYLHTIPGEDGSEQLVPLLTMELLTGETLSHRLARLGPMTPEEALPLLRQMAEALGAAHAVGVVHSDFKSSNVFLVRQEQGVRVVVTDFGLAEMVRMNRPGEDSGGGYIRGWTPGYAAPEQIGGRQMTAAADLFSLAVVAHQLVSGKLPQGDTVDEARLPPRWRAPVRRCLSTDPDARFASAAEFIGALEAPGPGRRALTRRALVGTGLVAAGAATAVLARRQQPQSARWRLSSLAVLPFEVSPSPESSLFESLTNDLIRTLVGSKRLRVVSPYSTGRYKPPYDFRRIARELSADGLLVGTISPDTVLVRLVEGKDGRQLWRGQFPRAAEPNYALHKNICAAIFAQFDLAAADLPPQPAHEPLQAAYIAYLNGRYFWNRRRRPSPADPRGDLDRAREFFERAVELDPQYAAAFAGLADTLLLTGGNPGAMRQAAEHAVRLDPNCVEAYLALAMANHRLEWNWTAAETDFQRALDREPLNSRAHHWYAGYLSDMGRFQESLSEFRMAAELDPLSVNISIARGICLFHARRFSSAIEELNRAVLLAESDSRPHTFLGGSWLYQDQRERAIAEYRRAVELDPDNPVTQAHLVFGLGRAGYREQAAVERGVLLRRKHGDRTPFYTALAHAGVGDAGSACHWMLIAENVRDENLTLLKVHPYCDPLRTEPCYRDLMLRMKLA